MKNAVLTGYVHVLIVTAAILSDVGGASNLSSLHLLGTGYNILKGNPVGQQGNHLDPGLLPTKSIFAYSNDPKVIKNVQLHSSCSQHESTEIELFFGPRSYQKHLLESVTTSEFNDVATATNNNHEYFRDEKVQCVLGSARYTSPLHGSNDHHVSNEFADQVCNTLTLNYDEKIYTDFIDQWGTHIVTGFNYGTKTINRYKESPANIAQFMIPHYPEASSLKREDYLGYSTVIYINTTALNHVDHTQIPKGQFYKTITYGDVSDPEPISLTLVTLSKAFEEIYWTRFPEFLESGICNGNISVLAIKKTNLEQALNQYSAIKNGHIPNADLVTKLPVTWPAGLYGLAKPLDGCPWSPFSWSEGARYQDNENDYNNNSHSNAFHLAGYFGINTKMYYCMKTSTHSSVYSRDWPHGRYCIYRKGGICPSGFTSGYIHTDDEDDNNKNSVSGTLPDGSYDRDTRIEYCCRADAPVKMPMILPIEKPFVLLRYGGHCQAVLDMTVSEEFRFYDDEDHNNGNSCGGSHPDSDCIAPDKKLYFCYYTPKNQIEAHIPGIIG